MSSARNGTEVLQGLGDTSPVRTYTYTLSSHRIRTDTRYDISKEKLHGIFVCRTYGIPTEMIIVREDKQAPHRVQAMVSPYFVRLLYRKTEATSAGRVNRYMPPTKLRPHLHVDVDPPVCRLGLLDVKHYEWPSLHFVRAGHQHVPHVSLQPRLGVVPQKQPTQRLKTKEGFQEAF